MTAKRGFLYSVHYSEQPSCEKGCGLQCENVLILKVAEKNFNILYLRASVESDKGPQWGNIHRIKI